MPNPLVSVLIPAYNAASTIGATLDSVLSQTYRPIEIVVVDDGSTDNTADVVRQRTCGAHDLSVILRSQPNRGLLVSRKRTVELCSGDILQFLDADDLLHPEKLCYCVPYLEQEKWDVVVPRTHTFSEACEVSTALGSAPEKDPWPPRVMKHPTITKPMWHSSGPLFRREVVERARPFDPMTHPVIEELEFHGRVKQVTQRIKYVPFVLSFYRKGQPGQITSDLRYLYEGLVSGCHTLLTILNEYENRRPRDWIAAYLYALRAHYCIVNHLPERELITRSRKAWIDIARSWHPIVGACTSLVAPAVPGLLRWGFCLRNRRLPPVRRQRKRYR